MQKIESTADHRRWEKTNYCYRSSALFYAESHASMDTEVSFLNHYLLKRDIKDVLCKVSLRDLSGRLIKRIFIEVNAPQTYTVSVRDIVGPDEFKGSVHVEYLSVKNIFVPYAAVVALYSSPEGLCQVHGYCRSYNIEEIEDGKAIRGGEEIGWTLRDGDASRSFLVIHHGQASRTHKVKLKIVNHKGELHELATTMPPAGPYATSYLEPVAFFPDLVRFLGGQPGHASVSFESDDDIFPRCLCGNKRLGKNGQTIDLQATHTNFNYALFDTDRLPAGESAFTPIPFYPADGKTSLLVYPGHMPTAGLVANGTAVEHTTLTRLTCEPGSRVTLSCSDERGLPNRIVDALVCEHPGRLPSECSVGVITSGYTAGTKHWYWGLAGHSDNLAFLNVIAFPDFLDPAPFKKQIQVTLYDGQGECGSMPVDTDFSGTLTINLEEAVNREVTGSLYYQVASDYPLLNIICAIHDRKKGSGCWEHSF